MFKFINFVSLAVVILLGALLRLPYLHTIPYGLFCDEAANGVDAYYLLYYGVDHNLNSPNFFLKSLGDYKGFVSIWSAIPSIAVFGLNEFSVRLPSAVYGILTILLIYLLANKLYGKTTGLISAIFLALSPWHIHISRMGFEFITFPFFLTLSLALLLYSVRSNNENDKNFLQNYSLSKKRFRIDKNACFLLLSFIGFGITLYTYSPARLITPLFLGFLIFLFRKDVFLKKYRISFVFSLFAFILLAIPLLINILNGKALLRLNTLSVSKLNLSPKETVFHMLETYRNYFSPIFLFVNGDIDFPGQNVTRHSVRGLGELYLFQAPLLIAGLYILLKKLKDYQSKIILFLILIYPLGGVFLIDKNPLATRGVIGVIPFQILLALGVFGIGDYLIKYFKKYFFIFLTVLGTFVLFSVYQLILLYSLYPQYSADYWGWQSGPREMIGYFLQNNDVYDEFYMDEKFNAPYIFFRFYIHDKNVLTKARSGGLENINPKKHQLFGIRKEIYDKLLEKKSVKVVSKIYYPNGEISYYLVEPLGQ